MLRQTPNRRHHLLAPANSDLESSDESRPGYHPVEVHTQAGPTQVSLHNQAVEALADAFCVMANGFCFVSIALHCSLSSYLLILSRVTYAIKRDNCAKRPRVISRKRGARHRSWTSTTARTICRYLRFLELPLISTAHANLRAPSLAGEPYRFANLSAAFW